jgi:prophage regulatory protein
MPRELKVFNPPSPALPGAEIPLAEPWLCLPAKPGRHPEVPPPGVYDILPLMRVSQILRVVPISASGWWKGVRDGRYPKPMKLSARVTVWKGEDIRELIDGRRDF